MNILVMITLNSQFTYWYAVYSNSAPSVVERQLPRISKAAVTSLPHHPGTAAGTCSIAYCWMTSARSLNAAECTSSRGRCTVRFYVTIFGLQLVYITRRGLRWFFSANIVKNYRSHAACNTIRWQQRQFAIPLLLVVGTNYYKTS